MHVGLHAGVNKVDVLGDVVAEVLTVGVGGHGLDVLAHKRHAVLTVAHGGVETVATLAGTAVDNGYEVIGDDDCVLVGLLAYLACAA